MPIQSVLTSDVPGPGKRLPHPKNYGDLPQRSTAPIRPVPPKRIHQPWTNHELTRLKQTYPTMTRIELAAEFPSRTIRSVVSAAGAHGLRKQDQRRSEVFWKAVAAAHVYTLGCLKQAAQ